MDDLNHRNTVAVEQALKTFTEKVLAQQERIDGLVATVGTMNERMNALERTILQQRAAMAGHGPTVR